MAITARIGAYTLRYTCSLCRAPKPDMVLQLPFTPLANEFVAPGRLSSEEPQEIYPLDLSLCRSCGHLQTNQIVHPGRLFSDYVYVTGTSPVTIEHLRRQSDQIIEKTGIKPGKDGTIVEIGSNDGSMLKIFRDYGYRVLGVDPAQNIVKEAIAGGIPTVCGFWNSVMSRDVVSDFGKADLVIANNVMAHVPDVFDFALGVKNLLANDGVFVFEVAHLLDLAEHMVWDTIYHEHMSYHAVLPLAKMFSEIGMNIVMAERFGSQMGRGSLRIYVKKGQGDKLVPEVSHLIHEELKAGLFEDEFYQRLSAKIALQREISSKNLDLLASRYSMFGYGATAKLTTLMYTLGLDQKHSQFIIDDNPKKQHLFTPGLHIPVMPPEHLLKYAPEVCVIYAWNFADSIMRRYRDFAARNQMTFVIPMPVYQEIQSGRGGASSSN